MEREIVNFIKEKLKIEIIIPDKVFQDGFSLYYDTKYVGDIKHIVMKYV